MRLCITPHKADIIGHKGMFWVIGTFYFFLTREGWVGGWGGACQTGEVAPTHTELFQGASEMLKAAFITPLVLTQMNFKTRLICVQLQSTADDCSPGLQMIQEPTTKSSTTNKLSPLPLYMIAEDSVTFCLL